MKSRCIYASRDNPEASIDQFLLAEDGDVALSPHVRLASASQVVKRWWQFSVIWLPRFSNLAAAINYLPKEKVLPHPKPMSQSVLVDPGWPGGSYCKPQLTVEVAEVVQGVEDEHPLRGISAVVVLIPQ